MNYIDVNFDNNIQNKRRRPHFKAEQAAAQVELPDMYYVPDSYKKPDNFKDTLKKVDVMDLVYPWIENPLLMLACCTGLAYSVDKFSEVCGGEYEKSLPGKAAKLGDNIQNSRFVKSKPVQQLLSGIKSCKNNVNHFFRNSDSVNAMKTTPSMPEWPVVKDEMLPRQQRVIHDFIKITDTYKLDSEGMIAVKDLGLNKSERQMLKKVFKKEVSKIDEREAVTWTVLKRLDKSQDEIDKILNLGDGSAQTVKDEILKAAGLCSAQLKEIKADNTGKYANVVKEACSKVKGKVRIGAGRYTWLGQFQPFERTIGCDWVYNRLHSISGGAKTGTGMFMSKLLQDLHRGYTFGGGKLSVLLFFGPFLAKAIKNTYKADSDKKAGTLAHGVVEFGTWAITFPAALKILHAAGGMQYAGMSKESVSKCRELLNDFNGKVTSDFFKSKTEYNSAKKLLEAQLKELKKAKSPQNLLTKISRKLGSFITMDLERIKSYRSGNIAINALRKIPSFLRNIAGVPIRLVLWGLIAFGLLDTIISKSLTAVFGKPYDEAKEEEHNAKKEKQEEFTHKDLKERMLEAQAEKIAAAKTPAKTSGQVRIQNIYDRTKKSEEKSAVQTVKQPEINTEEILIRENPNRIENQENKISTDSYSYIPSANSTIQGYSSIKRDNYTYIPSGENIFAKDNQKSSLRKYIPSQAGIKVNKNFDNSGLEGALKRADRAEQQAIKVLSGKFGNG